MRGSLPIVVLSMLSSACGGDAPSAGGSDSSSGAESTTATSANPTTGNPTTTTGTSATTTTTSASSTAADTTDTGATDESSDDGSGETGIFEMCFADQFVNDANLGPDYDQFAPTIGSHCLGTNHQDIAGIERVVFLGDSVTVGTPPTLSADYYRSKLGNTFAEQFTLAWGEGGNSQLLWQLVDLFNGTSIARDSGAFSSCAKWGARTDDLLAPGPQITDCFPEETRTLRTLVVITMGGNDLSSLTQAAIDGATQEMLWAQIMDAVDLQRQAVQWLKDPANFPNGSFVVFGNFYEFTDGTGDVMSCDVSGLAGFDQPIPAPDQLAEMVIWANEQYMSIAVDTESDMIFMLESFCGHGFNADDPTTPCYRGPGTEIWFDLTCIHPNPTGHQQIANMVTAVVDE